VYEPAMTKSFLHGRTEAIRSVQLESVEFTKVCRIAEMSHSLTDAM
jgi:Choline/Carnitine o-acyltransferase